MTTLIALRGNDVIVEKDMSGLDLLDIKQVYNIPGMRMQRHLPKPFIDLSKYAKGECPTNHKYWLRQQINDLLKG